MRFNYIARIVIILSVVIRVITEIELIYHICILTTVMNVILTIASFKIILHLMLNL
jgi:hypothetical protein